MARIDVLPSIEIIRGFKGILDFYVWRGLPCVRAWPKYRPANQTAASLAAALVFGAIVKAYSTMGEIALQAYRDDANGQPRSARDVYVSSQYGNLHEADMSDFLDLLQQSRDFLSQLTALLNALDSIDTDELVVNVDESVLPAGASTAAAQATQLTALQKLDDLQDALESKALDRLLVRGMDQLHSFSQNLLLQHAAVVSGNDGYIQVTVPDPGPLWVITNIESVDLDTATTLHWYSIFSGGVHYWFDSHEAAMPAATSAFWHGWAWAHPTEIIRIYFTGALAGDDCRITITGHRMTLET